MKRLFQTKAFQGVLELLHNEHVLTVIGPPGCGKSTAINHAALQLRDKEDYVIVPVNFPVYFDITSAKNALSEKERSRIAEVYLSPNEVLALQKSNIFTKYDFFPLLCQLYSPKESSDVVVYFSDPIKAINVELESQMNETDQTTLATLFLFVIYNNCIDENIFNQKSDEIYILSTEINCTPEKTEDLLKIVLSLSEKESSPLLTVANQGFNFLVNSLIDIGLTVNVRDEIGRSPLFLATDSNHAETVDLLLNKSDNPDLCNNKQVSPLHMACLNENIEIVKLEGKINPWFVFKNIHILINIIKKTKIIIKRAILLELANSHENVCAEHAIHSGMLCCFGFKGPLSKPDSAFNMTPLYIASINGFTDVVELLLNHNANPCLGTGFNETPIFSAAEKGRVEIVKLLLKFKADPNLCNKDNVCPLQRASLNGFSEVVYMLVIHGGIESLRWLHRACGQSCYTSIFL
ncbi:unnamed protein product [Mytilus edulis]|uniref:Novel STAND NTPase 3 domain-containing protein n=1 Tax=Mytilus edulis TaxID=6550 RepID=A0A8S3T6V8_MYTED|nr:unnamed protein product [Mytilus edulis]